MAIKTADIHRILIERIEGSHPAPALFSATEIDEWPAEALDALLNCGVLQPASRAESAWCPGCEWQCHKTVVVRTGLNSPQTEAFITCDEEPDLGRIAVPTRNLAQYGTSSFGREQVHRRPDGPWRAELIGGRCIFPAGDYKGPERALSDDRRLGCWAVAARSERGTRATGPGLALGRRQSVDR